MLNEVQPLVFHPVTCLILKQKRVDAFVGGSVSCAQGMKTRLDELRIQDGCRNSCSVDSPGPIGNEHDIADETSVGRATVELAEDSAPEPLDDSAMRSAQVCISAEDHLDDGQRNQLCAIGQKAGVEDVPIGEESRSPEECLPQRVAPPQILRERDPQSVFIAGGYGSRAHPCAGQILLSCGKEGHCPEEIGVA